MVLDRYRPFPTQGKLIAPCTENITEYQQLFANVFIFISSGKKLWADNLALEPPGVCTLGQSLEAS